MFGMRHWAEIDQNHQDALATSEVLITPQGPNNFDEFGEKGGSNKLRWSGARRNCRRYSPTYGQWHLEQWNGQ
jgi:hypothetical protein